MLDIEEFFSKLSEFPYPELFSKQLEGFEDLIEIWDILKRIQHKFVSGVIEPKILGEIEDGAIIRGDDIYLGKGSKIYAGAMVVGPTIIGENVEIRHGAYVRGHVIAGNNSVIGHATEIVRSILMPGAKAPHFNYVGDSILGTNVNLGAGTKLSNLKNDGSNVKIKINNKIVDTGLRKFGAILADNCQLGCNSVTNPGTVMEKGCRVYPCAMINGYLKSNTIHKLRQTSEQVFAK